VGLRARQRRAAAPRARAVPGVRRHPAQPWQLQVSPAAGGRRSRQSERRVPARGGTGLWGHRQRGAPHHTGRSRFGLGTGGTSPALQCRGIHRAPCHQPAPRWSGMGEGFGGFGPQLCRLPGPPSGSMVLKMRPRPLPSRVPRGSRRLPVADRRLPVPAGSDTASQQEFTSCLKETLSGLAKNATDLQVRPPRPALPRVPPAPGL